MPQHRQWIFRRSYLNFSRPSLRKDGFAVPIRPPRNSSKRKIQKGHIGMGLVIPATFGDFGGWKTLLWHKKEKPNTRNGAHASVFLLPYWIFFADCFEIIWHVLTVYSVRCVTQTSLPHIDLYQIEDVPSFGYASVQGQRMIAQVFGSLIMAPNWNLHDGTPGVGQMRISVVWNASKPACCLTWRQCSAISGEQCDWTVHGLKTKTLQCTMCSLNFLIGSKHELRDCKILLINDITAVIESQPFSPRQGFAFQERLRPAKVLPLPQRVWCENTFRGDCCRLGSFGELTAGRQLVRQNATVKWEWHQEISAYIA